MRKTLSLLFIVALLGMMALNVSTVQANPAVKIGGGMKWYTGTGYDWTIVKSADQTHLNLAPGQLFTVNYDVTVTASPEVISYGTIANIVIGNVGLPDDVTILSAKVIMNDGSEFAATCGDTVLSTNETTLCVSAPIPLPNALYRVVTFSAVISMNGVESTITAPDYVDFTDTGRKSTYTPPVSDDCIDVSDTNVGSLGTVCAGSSPKTFEYALDFGAHPDADVELVCGENTHRNVASFVTDDTDTTGEDDAVVTATVACGGGCTLTPGYWKTHSINGPAHYDDTWAQIGESTPFFLSSYTYYSILWAPVNGNPYINLAHHYIAALLNQYNGATLPANVQTALNSAATFFATANPNTVWTNAQKTMLNGWATTLDNYNNGLTGPGHCTE